MLAARADGPSLHVKVEVRDGNVPVPSHMFERRSCHFVFDTQIKSQLARTLYDIKCVAALLIRPRKVTQILITRRSAVRILGLPLLAEFRYIQYIYAMKMPQICALGLNG